MGRISTSSDIVNIQDDQEKFRYIQLFMADAMQQINGNLEITSNIKAKLVSVTFSTANANTSVAHGLGKVPLGYLVAGKSVSGVNVYDGTVASTTSTISLRSAGVGVANILFF